MVRRTSKMAYDQIKRDGLLPKRRMQCYEIVYQFGPITSAEAFMKINVHSEKAAITSSRSRFTELRDMGCIAEDGTKICTVTGYESIAWVATANLPIKLPKKTTSKDRKKEVLGMVENIGKNMDDGELKEELRYIYKLIKKI